MNKNIKILSLISIISVIALLTMSCKSNEEPKDIGNYPPKDGEYYSQYNTANKTPLVTVSNNNGICNIKGKIEIGNTTKHEFNIYVENWTKHKDGNGAGANSGDNKITGEDNYYVHVGWQQEDDGRYSLTIVFNEKSDPNGFADIQDMFYLIEK